MAGSRHIQNRWLLERLEDGVFFEDQQPLVAGLESCPQDPIHHAEGDALIHTGMVCRELVRLPGFQQASDEERQILAWAALLHDIAKPECLVIDSDGRVGSPGHALKGSLRARRLLWELDCPFPIREEIVGLIAHHMAPQRVFQKEVPGREVRRFSLDCRCRLLAILVEADIRGRICGDKDQLLENVELFADLAREEKVWEQPATFATPAARYQYFEGRWHLPEQAPFEDFRCRVVMLSGLPGAGKDTWIAKHHPDWPVISLDELRQSMGIAPTASQGAVIDAAREMARVYLREGRDFVWNATNVSGQVRRKCLSLFFDYNAFVTIVYLERSRSVLFKQNKQREAVVPTSILEKLLRKWEVPSLLEAHQVEYHAL